MLSVACASGRAAILATDCLLPIPWRHGSCIRPYWHYSDPTTTAASIHPACTASCILHLAPLGLQPTPWLGRAV